MQSFAALSMLVTLIATLVIGVRMLGVARRTRQLPELLFGIAFLGGGVGQGFAQLGQRFLWTEPGLLATSMNTGLFGLVVVGNAGLYVVIWRVFRPSTTGAVVSALGVGAMLVGYGMRIGGGELAGDVTFGNGMRLVLLSRISLFCWISIEAFRHAAKLARRAELGLADRLAPVQIRLWGTAGVANAGLLCVIAWYTIELGVNPLEFFVPTCLILAAVFVATATMWLAFFPPASMVARYRAGATSSPA